MERVAKTLNLNAVITNVFQCHGNVTMMKIVEMVQMNNNSCVVSRVHLQYLRLATMETPVSI